MRKEKYIKIQKHNGVTYFRVYFTYNDGQDRYTKCFKSSDYATEAQALNAACKDRDHARAELIDGTLNRSSTATVTQMFEEYQKLFVTREGTRKLHAWYFEKYIAPQYGRRQIASITAKDIMVNLTSLVYECSTNDLTKIKSVWACIMKNARISHVIMINPMEEVVMPKSQKITVPRNQYVPDEDIDKIVEYLSNGKRALGERQAFDQQIVALIVQFMRATGIRPAECYAIQRGVSYDFHARVVHICQQYGTDNSGGAIVHVKANSMRDLPMTDEMEDILRHAEEITDHEFIFQTYEGRFQNSASIGTILNRACEATGVKDFHLYSLRHGLITKAIKETGDVRAVMEIAGHKGSTAAMSLDYARSTSENKRKLLELVENSRKRA